MLYIHNIYNINVGLFNLGHNLQGAKMSNTGKEAPTNVMVTPTKSRAIHYNSRVENSSWTNQQRPSDPVPQQIPPRNACRILPYLVRRALFEILTTRAASTGFSFSRFNAGRWVESTNRGSDGPGHFGTIRDTYFHQWILSHALTLLQKVVRATRRIDLINCWLVS